jgi:hypothetical protein
MNISKRLMRSTAILGCVFSTTVICSDASAQFRIGGDDGVVIGGGQGLRIGGGSGVQFGGGQGAKFGGTSGVQFGGGAGAKFGGPSGVQFGAGQGAKFGGDDGVQFGGGAGAKFGQLQVGGEPAATIDKPVAVPVDGPIVDRPLVERAPERPQPALIRPTAIYFPKEAKEPLEFTLNDHPFKVEPGQTVSLRGDRRWVIRYAPGPNAELQVYALPSGDYTFKQKANGWNMFRNKPNAPVAETLPSPQTNQDAR